MVALGFQYVRLSVKGAYGSGLPQSSLRLTGELKSTVPFVFFKRLLNSMFPDKLSNLASIGYGKPWMIELGCLAVSFAKSTALLFDLEVFFLLSLLP